MRKVLKKWCGALVALCMLVTIIPITTFAADSGEGWSLDDNGLLTIENDTGMTNWDAYEWDQFLNYNNDLSKTVKTLSFGNDVTIIPEDAFNSYENLTNIVFWGGVTEIEDNAFEGTALKSIDLTNSNIKTIGDNAFRNCENLTNVNGWGTFLTTIGNTFQNCINLDYVAKLPASLTNIDDSAFLRTDITSFTVDENNPSFSTSKQGVLLNKSGDTLLIFPSGRENICYAVESGITSIAEFGFSNTKIDSVIIPEEITSIGDYAFVSCENLTTATFEGTIPPTIGTEIFLSCNALTSICVPSDSTDDYKTTLSDYSDKMNKHIDILANSIETYTGGDGATGSLTTAVDGNTITVTGTITNVTAPLLLQLDSDEKIIWNASISSAETFNENSLISISGINGAIDTALEIAEGGRISATSTNAINAYTNIEVSGGEVFNTADKTIISSRENGTITVSGGTVFGYGDSIFGLEQGNILNTMNNSTGFTEPSGDGIVIAWNKDAGITSYTEGTNNDIVFMPNDATATWANQDGKSGISYSNGSNTGFIEITNVTVLTADTTPNPDPTPDQTTTPNTTPNYHDTTTTTEKIADVVNNLEDGDNLTIKPTSDNKSISGDVLKEIKDKDIEVTVKVADGLEWSFSGNDILDNWDEKDINFNINTENFKIPSKTLKSFIDGKVSKTLSLDFDGEFGFEMTLSVHIGYLNNGQYANLYYYNPTNNEFEFMASSKINGAGNAKFNFTHASDYVILVDEKEITSLDTSIDNTNTTTTIENESNPVTADNSNIPVYLVAILSFSTFIIVIKKRKA